MVLCKIDIEAGETCRSYDKVVRFKRKDADPGQKKREARVGPPLWIFERYRLKK